MKNIEARTTQQLIDCYDSREKIKYLFFWGHTPSSPGLIDKSCLSQWYSAKFTVKGVTYKTSEHYMMAQKALLFSDLSSYYKIIYCSHPGEAQALGRKVSNFKHDVWQQQRFNIVVSGNYYKFSQNPQLQEYLLSSSQRVLVEASPKDTIWGIGLAESESNINNPSTWKGMNLLGFALMEARKLIGQNLQPPLETLFPYKE